MDQLIFHHVLKRNHETFVPQDLKFFPNTTTTESVTIYDFKQKSSQWGKTSRVTSLIGWDLARPWMENEPTHIVMWEATLRNMGKIVP